MMECRKCGIKLDEYSAYEYRGAISCEEHFEEVCIDRDYERKQIIRQEESDSVIGKANRKLMKGAIEVASRESVQVKKYEAGDNND